MSLKDQFMRAQLSGKRIQSLNKSPSKLRSIAGDASLKVSKHILPNSQRGNATASLMKHVSVISLNSSIVNQKNKKVMNFENPSPKKDSEKIAGGSQSIPGAKPDGYFDSILHKNIGFLNNRILNESIVNVTAFPL